MALSVKTRKLRDVVILDLAGQVTVGEPVLMLRNTLRSYLDDGSRKFVVNLGEVSYVDSSGLGELVTSHASVRNRGGRVNLLNLTKRIQDLMQMTKLLTVFDVYDDEARAVQALDEAAAAKS